MHDLMSMTETALDSFGYHYRLIQRVTSKFTDLELFCLALPVLPLCSLPHFTIILTLMTTLSLVPCNRIFTWTTLLVAEKEAVQYYRKLGP